jgi:hypothetical protein
MDTTDFLMEVTGMLFAGAFVVATIASLLWYAGLTALALTRFLRQSATSAK